MTPILSVIIPCFNGGDYLRQLLECCIAQSFKSWEIIVVDDGSTDNTTIDILKDITSKDNRIFYYVRDRLPKGGDTCRNIGFDKAKGKYIIFFDADDLISSTCFENRVRFMEINQDCDFASFPAAYFEDGSELPKWDMANQKTGIKRGNRDNLYYLLTYNYPFTVWSNIYRKKAIEGIHWDEKVMVMQDLDWMLSCEFAGLKHKYCSLNDYDYYYRQFKDGHNVCGNFVNESKYNSTIYLFSKILNTLDKRDDSEERKKQFFVYITIQMNRLILSGDIKKVDRFIEVSKHYYSEKYIRSLYKFVSLFYNDNLNPSDITPLKIYYNCSRVYKSKRYIIYFVKNMIKRIFGKEQTLYQ